MREIVELYPEPKPHPNTISTFMKILVEKEFLTTEKEGRIFKYHVVVPFKDYRTFQLRKFIEHYYENCTSELLKQMINEKYLKLSDFNRFFEIKTTVVPVQENIEIENPLNDFINEILE
jgi:predicted transcriptional regulator